METGQSCFTAALPDSDGVPVTVYRYAQLDMDGDTIPEIVLWLQRGDDIYLLGNIILRYEGGVVYGYPMGYRSMYSLKADGTYSWSGGGDYWGWGRMDFQTGKTENISWVEGQNYYVDGHSTTREAFFQAYDVQDAKPDVAWYVFSGADPGSLERVHPVVEQDWLTIVKPEQEEMQRLVELSEQPSLDMENLRFFSAEELAELKYGGGELFGRPITYERGGEFAPIQGAPDSPEAFRKRLEEQFAPELADEEYHFALELGESSRCLFAEGKMWRRVVDWTEGLHWEYDWDTFTVIESGEDFVTYEIDGYRNGRGSETPGTRRFTLQKDIDGQWKYSARG